ncbi:hypothetical protein GCM10007984_23710 [Shewanella putrefaciens]|nr:hypothetical protein GCM10007984_23710 [Shewanella putrefaciens]
MLRIKLLSVLAKLMRVQFKVDGLPYGATKRAQVSSTIHGKGSLQTPNCAESEQQK